VKRLTGVLSTAADTVQITQEAAMAQEKKKRGDDGSDDDDDSTAGTGAGQERREKLAEQTDDLVRDIDGLLEEDAAGFVRAYVQKGGQ
jgi:prokaryotic ubiquitin-like protein Pup